MIRHICMFKLKEENKAGNLAEMIARAQSLYAIESMKAMDVVTNDPATPDSNYDICLICDFEDVESLNAYQSSPIHVAFGQFVGTVRESRACIDYKF